MMPKRLFQQNLAKAELDEGNHLLPKMYLERSIRDELCASWHDAIVIKLLGKNVGFLTMRDCRKKLWKPSEGFDMLDIVCIENDLN